MSIMNELLEQIVIAAGGVVRNPNIRNWLLEDWLDAESVVPIPVNAQLYYLFTQTNLTKAITEQVGQKNQAYTERPSNINLAQSSSGQIVTYAAGVAAFDRGQNLQVWRGATNNLDNPSWAGAGNNTSPNFWITDVTGTPIYTGINEGEYESIDFSVEIGDAVRFRIAGLPRVINVTQILSVRVKKPVNCSSTDVIRLDDFPSTSTFYYNGILINGADILVGDGLLERRIIPTNTGGGGIASVGLVVSGLSPSVKSVNLSIPNLVTEETASPPILGTTSSPSTRAPTDQKLSLFTENGLTVDAPSDDDGVNPATCTPTSQTTITISGSQKYTGFLTAALIGTLVTFASNGAICEVTANPNATDLTVTVIKGVIPVSADEEITLDLSQSDYFTNPLATMITDVRQFRIDGGDDSVFLDSLPLPTLIDDDDFEWIITVDLFEIPEDGSLARILEMNIGISLINNITIEYVSAGNIAFNVGSSNIIGLGTISLGINTFTIKRQAGVFSASLNGVYGGALVEDMVPINKNILIANSVNDDKRWNLGVIDFTTVLI